MFILLIISMLMFVAYIVTNVFINGVTDSISDTYYLNGKSGQFAFWSWALLTAFPMMIYWLDISEDTFQPLVFLSTAALIFVGTAGAFKESMTNQVHTYAAIGSFLLSHLWLAIYCTQMLPFCLLMFAILMSIGYNTKVTNSDGQKVRAWLYFAELACFINIYASLIYFVK